MSGPDAPDRGRCSFDLRYGDRFGDAVQRRGIDQFPVCADDAREPLPRKDARRGTAIRRRNIVGGGRKCPAPEMHIACDREPLRARPRVAIAERHAVGDRLDGRPDGTQVDQLARREPARIVPAGCADHAAANRDDIRRGGADVDQDRIGDQARHCAGRRGPIRRGDIERHIPGGKRCEKLAVHGVDVDFHRWKCFGHRIENEGDAVALDAKIL
jgi:hypothetical protein